MPETPAPPPPRKGIQIEVHSAIPRMGMNVPMPSSTRPPAQSGQQSSSTTQQARE
jgi:hypothetical protein